MKVRFVLRQGGTGLELAQKDADSSYPTDEAADYAGQMTRWLAEDYIILNVGDTLTIEEVE